MELVIGVWRVRADIVHASLRALVRTGTICGMQQLAGRWPLS
jgi:hypothetical protein